MKVFISWSGTLSHKVAISLRDWLPSVIQTITPYVSSEDIDKGARWSSDIASELDQSAFGILCVTKENFAAPWLNFEAGALGKSIDKSKVCPFLFRIKRSEVEGPVLQYQSTIYEKEDTFKLLKSINEACLGEGITEQQLEKCFEVWWPQLQSSLDSIEIIPESESVVSQEAEPKQQDEYLSGILEELLEISRTNQKLLRDPEAILPEDYFEHILRRIDRNEMGKARHLVNHYAVALKDVECRIESLIGSVLSREAFSNTDKSFTDELMNEMNHIDGILKSVLRKKKRGEF